MDKKESRRFQITFTVTQDEDGFFLNRVADDLGMSPLDPPWYIDDPRFQAKNAAWMAVMDYLNTVKELAAKGIRPTDPMP